MEWDSSRLQTAGKENSYSNRLESVSKAACQDAATEPLEAE